MEYKIRSNLYLFLFFRYLAGKFLTRFAHESDFELFSAFEYDDGVFLDIGANDGISVKTFKIYNKKMKIISVEANDINEKHLNQIKKKYHNYDYVLKGASNLNCKKKLYQAYFKDFHLSPFDSLSLDEIKESLEKNLFDNKRKTQIYIKGKEVELIKLDNLKLEPTIIKIDIQGHEFECIKGLENTIEKKRPVLLLEYNEDSIKIIKYLKKFDLNPYYYRSKNKTIYELKDNKPFGFFMLNNDHLKKFNNKFKLNFSLK